MTDREAKIKSKEICLRNHLSKIELKNRLYNYFNEEEITDIFCNVEFSTLWTDGNITVLYFPNRKDYSVITNGLYIKLIV